MKLSTFLYIQAILLLVYIQLVSCLFDPLTIGAGITAAVGYFGGYSYLKDQTYCRLSECCNERHIPGDIGKLQLILARDLFGQHIVQQHLVPALDAHFSPDNKSKKPLVISFHGTPGTGKNFVADRIAEALYANGAGSRFVHKYLGRADFPLTENVEIYKKRINKEVRDGIAECPRSLFIFDEVEKMPPGIFESLSSLVDYHQFLDGQDNTKAIFIFLSNTAGVQISDRLGKLIKDGSLREDTKLSDFEQILEKAAYNLEGGMKKTGLIESHVIDHYLPFLPLEKSHVTLCVNAEFRRWNAWGGREEIESIIKESVTYDRTHGLFATSGCKILEKKVAVAVMSKKRTNVVK